MFTDATVVHIARGSPSTVWFQKPPGGQAQWPGSVGPVNGRAGKDGVPKAMVMFDYASIGKRLADDDPQKPFCKVLDGVPLVQYKISREGVNYKSPHPFAATALAAYYSSIEPSVGEKARPWNKRARDVVVHVVPDELYSFVGVFKRTLTADVASVRQGAHQGNLRQFMYIAGHATALAITTAARLEKWITSDAPECCGEECVFPCRSRTDCRRMRLRAVVFSPGALFGARAEFVRALPGLLRGQQHCVPGGASLVIETYNTLAEPNLQLIAATVKAFRTGPAAPPPGMFLDQILRFLAGIASSRDVISFRTELGAFGLRLKQSSTTDDVDMALAELTALFGAVTVFEPPQVVVRDVQGENSTLNIHSSYDVSKIRLADRERPSGGVCDHGATSREWMLSENARLTSLVFEWPTHPTLETQARLVAWLQLPKSVTHSPRFTSLSRLSANPVVCQHRDGSASLVPLSNIGAGAEQELLAGGVEPGYARLLVLIWAYNQYMGNSSYTSGHGLVVDHLYNVLKLYNEDGPVPSPGDADNYDDDDDDDDDTGNDAPTGQNNDSGLATVASMQETASSRAWNELFPDYGLTPPTTTPAAAVSAIPGIRPLPITAAALASNAEAFLHDIHNADFGLVFEEQQGSQEGDPKRPKRTPVPNPEQNNQQGAVARLPPMASSLQGRLFNPGNVEDLLTRRTWGTIADAMRQAYQNAPELPCIEQVVLDEWQRSMIRMGDAYTREEAALVDGILANASNDDVQSQRALYRLTYLLDTLHGLVGGEGQWTQEQWAAGYSKLLELP